MPLPLVVVEIVAEHATPELRQTLLHACSRAAVEAECVAADEAVDESRTAAVAIVSFSTPVLVRVQVGIKQDGRWLNRQLAFTPEDAPREVFTAVGFATGTLAGRARAGESDEDENTGNEPGSPVARTESPPKVQLRRSGPPKTPPTPKPSAPVAPKPVAATRRVTARVGGLFQAVASNGPWAVGPTLRVSWIHRTGVLVALGAREGRAARDTHGLAARMWDAGAGIGFSFEPFQPLAWELDADLAAQSWSFDVVEPLGNATARGDSSTVAVRTAATVSALLVKPFALFASSELTWPVKGIDVEVWDRPVLRTLVPSYGFVGGLELRLF